MSSDGLPQVNNYERETFLQHLKRRAKPVFGKGWTVTRDDIRAAYWAVNPEYRDQPMAESLFDMMLMPAMVIEVEESGYKVIEP